MSQEERISFQTYSAVGMLVSGIALSVAGFVVDPLGEISDSVLWYFAQCLIYAGSVFGVGVYLQSKFLEMKREIKTEEKNEKD